MARDKGPTRHLRLPRAEVIAGTLDDLAKKYHAVSEVDLEKITEETVATQLNELASRVKAGGLPEVKTIAGTLDDLAKKYKAAAEVGFRLPIAESVAGTLDDLAKKYTGKKF